MKPDLIVALLVYFGALLIPIGYLAITRFRGPARRLMVVGFGLQIFWSAVVWAFVYFSWRAGYTDAWMGWGLLLPVNVVGCVYFSAVFVWYASRARTERQRN